MNAAPQHGGLMTLAEWNALPEDSSQNYELVRGVLQVNARAVPTHQRALARLLVQLDRQLPHNYVVLPEVEVIVEAENPPTVRVPDLSVVPNAAVATEPARFRASDVCLAVEILSPRTARTDREVKFFEYTDAGIEHYWIADTEEPMPSPPTG